MWVWSSPKEGAVLFPGWVLGEGNGGDQDGLALVSFLFICFSFPNPPTSCVLLVGAVSWTVVAGDWVRRRWVTVEVLITDQAFAGLVAATTSQLLVELVEEAGFVFRGDSLLRKWKRKDPDAVDVDLASACRCWHHKLKLREICFGQSVCGHCLVRFIPIVVPKICLWLCCQFHCDSCIGALILSDPYAVSLILSDPPCNIG